MPQSFRMDWEVNTSRRPQGTTLQSGCPKTRWRFNKTGEDWFCIAGITGADSAALSMLTAPPGPDVAPIHNRQIVVLERSDWRGWLEGGPGATQTLTALPAGALSVAEAPRVKLPAV